MKLNVLVKNGTRIFAGEHEIVFDKTRGEIHIHNKWTRDYVESWPVGKVTTMMDLQVEVAYWERAKINGRSMAN